jgi:hypothetical protein
MFKKYAASNTADHSPRAYQYQIDHINERYPPEGIIACGAASIMDV